MNTTLKTFVDGRLGRGQSLQNLITLYGAQGIAVVTGLIYSKLLSTYVSPDQFGQYSISLAGALLAYSCLGTPTIQAFKFTLQRYPVELTIRFYIGLLFRLYVMAGVVLLPLVGFGVIQPVICLASLGIVLQSASGLCNDFLNTTFRYKSFAILQAISPIINLALLGLLIILWPYSQYAGLWIAYILLYTCLFLYAFRKIQQQQPSVTIKWQWVTSAEYHQLWPLYRKYITPLVIYGLFGWATAYLDRYLINYLMAATDVGYYSVGYSLGARIAVIASPLLAHLTPIVLASHATTEGNKAMKDSQRIIWQHLAVFWIISLPACLLLFVFRNEVGRLVLSELYQPAFLIVPLISLAYVFSLSVQFFETQFYASNQTKYILWQSIVGVVVNLILNFLLIPQYGIAGTAFSMIGSAFMQLTLAAFLYQRQNIMLKQ